MLLEGPMGQAERAPIPDSFVSGVDCWLMTLPHQAPGDAWDQYVLQTITLADVPGMPPAMKSDPANTHEMLVQTLDPSRRWTINDAGGFTPIGSRPNVVVQFRVRSDDMARDVTEMAARACVDGMLIAESSVIVFPLKADGTPDVEAGGQEKVILQVIQMWKHSITLLAEHEMTGGHHGAHN